MPGIDIRDDPVDLVSLEGGDMQDGTEYLAFHLGNAGHPKNVGPDKTALARCFKFGNQAALFLHLRAIGQQRLACLLVDDRADIGRDQRGITDVKHGKRALQHFERLLRYILLDIEDA